MFQSHAGSIEACLWANNIDPRKGFNPTLVRLRPSGPSACAPLVWREFQSHAGSIEARPVAREALVGLWVSIPRWFD